MLCGMNIEKLNNDKIINNNLTRLSCTCASPVLFCSRKLSYPDANQIILTENEFDCMISIFD